MPLRKDIKKVLVIGSGPIVIGQAAEFDYAGTQACLALKEEGLEVILINSNPATIMTDSTVADKVYIEPLTVESIEVILKKERPDGMIATLGGQTGLNLGVKLHEAKILEKYHVEMLGTSVESIKKGEDRESFRNLMLQIEEPIPSSEIIHTIEEGVDFAKIVGFPLIIRPAYTLGGEGGGFASNYQELKTALKKGLALSPINQVLLEQSIKGWKEVEYEVMRDENDTCIIVCNMENMDPVGVHTGDSIVVAPSQTLTDVQYQILRDASIKVIRELEIIGGCNIQFALNPYSNDYNIIEVNPRVSRSSALASKATGYPIARMAAKCAVGYHLDELLNPITGTTYASFEPAIDYIVVKLPRFPFDKFAEADRTLGTQMKATGEVMAIDRTFEGALNKGLRSLEMNVSGLFIRSLKKCTTSQLSYHLENVTDLRIFAIAESFRQGSSIEEIHEITAIDYWFLDKIEGLIDLEKRLASYKWEELPLDVLLEAKSKNISDQYLAFIFNITESEIRQKRRLLGLKPGYKLVDTCAAEFDAITPYYYSTWKGIDEIETSDKKKVLVIGSGPIRIGQGIEFDYCSVHATLALKKKGYEAIVMNNNPETVSTDYSIADRLYFEPLTVEDILHVIEKEKVEGVLIQFGGQTAINVAQELVNEGVPVLGTSIEAIDQLEDRKHFYDFLTGLNIPHILGKIAFEADQLIDAADDLGYPVLVRPSYVIGGQSMFIFNQQDELIRYSNQLIEENNQKIWPLLVDKYIPGLECEVDVISDGENVIIPGIFEHIERAGVHSGDSIAIFPPLTLTDKLKNTLVEYARKIAQELPVIGMMNVQFVVSDEKVFVLEVNPRASRTVPIFSKVTNIPMIEWATLVQLGVSLDQLYSKQGLLKEPAFYSVKSPVFSAGKLREVDHVLGPEMKSTGEVLGLGMTVSEALKKALFLGGSNPFSQADLNQHYVLCSITDSQKRASLSYVKELVRRNFSVIATEGTANYYIQQGIHVEVILSTKEMLREYIRQGEVAAIINIPNQGRIKEKLGFYLREESVRNRVPCFTCLDTVKAAITSSSNHVELHIRSMNEYYHLNDQALLTTFMR
ncbi:carbamoyl-phosphate synthase (glutamine-hydrolyzing) large subunit [Rossellomorea sp. BNER]|uniref:carbamoyl-phosphate synthase (glutamine-hydrolyzing) large subunit n=1 Tax=Rossellomorea sp. BNER TaxID=2962031 RepID=UPI003AF2F95A|nr:carbamoyl-phosphate synthase (glutamine-hydrolyzing) large subunit [Rossellomorea sp. BNER]